MRTPRYLIATLLALVLTLPALAQAQGGTPTGGAKLVGYATLPAAALADGPTAGNAFAGKTTINGIRVPFDSQPIGTIIDLIPGGYPNTWLALTGSHFDTAANSADYYLRIYTLGLDLRRSSGGSGEVSALNWQNLTDPSKKIKQPIKDSIRRVLSGADFAPRAFQLAKDGTFWVAEADGPSLLHFSAYGKLMDMPIVLSGAGALQGMSMTPDDKSLIIAQQSSATNAQIVFRAFNLTSKTMGQQPMTSYALTDTAYMVNGFSMINAKEAVVIEQDGKAGSAAQFKQVYLADLSVTPAKKTMIADLLKIDDPNNLSGLGTTFTFPYSDIGAIYPADDQTLMLVNNNHVPFGKERGGAQADPTEYITIQLNQPLNVDQAFLRPLK